MTPQSAAPKRRCLQRRSASRVVSQARKVSSKVLDPVAPVVLHRLRGFIDSSANCMSAFSVKHDSTMRRSVFPVPVLTKSVNGTPRGVPLAGAPARRQFVPSGRTATDPPGALFRRRSQNSQTSEEEPRPLNVAPVLALKPLEQRLDRLGRRHGQLDELALGRAHLEPDQSPSAM